MVYDIIFSATNIVLNPFCGIKESVIYSWFYSEQSNMTSLCSVNCTVILLNLHDLHSVFRRSLLYSSVLFSSPYCYVYKENKPVGNFVMGMSVVWCPRSNVCSNLSSDVGGGGVGVGVGAWTEARGEQRGCRSAPSAAHMHVQTVGFVAALMRCLHPGSQYTVVLGAHPHYAPVYAPTYLMHVQQSCSLPYPRMSTIKTDSFSLVKIDLLWRGEGNSGNTALAPASNQRMNRPLPSTALSTTAR